MTSIPPLYLLHTQPDARLLAAWMAQHQRRYAHHSHDMGDALHGLLRAAFGEHAPQPFRYIDEHQGLLAYTTLDAQAMEAQVALADPIAAQTLGLSACANHSGYRLRAFPTQWPANQVLGFEVRVRPTVRGARGRGEQDAFLHAVAQAGGKDGAAVDRGAVYAQWLREHLAERKDAPQQPWQGAVELLDVQLQSFARSKAMRRTQATASQPRQGHASEGPDAVLTGHLRITDPTAFAHLLVRGIGRHRAFGFGMLMLHRPR